MIKNKFDFTTIKDLIKKLDDDNFWEPICNSAVEEKFDHLIEEIVQSQNWPSSRNHEKGKLFEKLIGLILNQFQIAEITSDFTVKDNQIDHEIKIAEMFRTNFTAKIGDTIICECKNEKTKVDVTYMSKLIELCESRDAKTGIFFSIQGLTGKGWIHAEGKRKKNFLRKGLIIIHFNFEEIKSLKTKNLYTLIKKKVQMLVDETEESLDDIYVDKRLTLEEKIAFNVRLLNNVKQFERLGLINKGEALKIERKINNLYCADTTEEETG
ncbi:restriction endonuclease [Bacillus haynesii]|uniref:restriction endonuclease n=1 Tax=Bacillus haynesii TaxID=1925021 RepID=UPI00228270C3|nr:restriction endonuclease [Bacillus haynesii]MCY8010351.1 restriction endonuclease [Bacillus haynesii]MCY9217344.1 restriction endonuclease [Bacillus haynesii]